MDPSDALDRFAQLIGALTEATTEHEVCVAFFQHGLALSGADAAAVHAGTRVAVSHTALPTDRAVDVPLRVAARDVGKLTLYRSQHAAMPSAHATTAARLLALALDRIRDGANLEALKGTEEELQRALRARDEFLSIASHELNTPLTVLQLNMQSLRRKLGRSAGIMDATQFVAAIETMAGQIERLGRLLSNLLDVSRIRHNRLFLDREAFDLCQTVHDMAARLSSVATARAASITVNACETAIGYWDRLRIEQVLANLITNALKYGKGRPVEIRVSADDDSAKVNVTDHGIGISAEDRKRIFERFERATAIEQTVSFGLGLYITREIVRAHGGSLEVSSEPGQGSTFTVHLPLHRMEPRPEER